MLGPFYQKATARASASSAAIGTFFPIGLAHVSASAGDVVCYLSVETAILLLC